MNVKKLILLALCFWMANVQAAWNIAVLGDSNTWLGGDECDKPKGWTSWFKTEVMPASCFSYARSGATWTNTPKTLRNTAEYTEVLSNDNVIYNQVCRLKDAVGQGKQPSPNLIIIAAGTNDAWFVNKRPHAFEMPAEDSLRIVMDILMKKSPSEVLTLSESVSYNCRLLQTCFPNAQLVLLTPMQSTKVSNVLIAQTGDIIEACGKQLHATVVRMDRESCVKSQRERRKHYYTTDGTHTNEQGAKRNGHLLATIIQQTIKNF